MARAKYKRTCSECKEVSLVTYRPEPHVKCRACSSRDTAYSSIHARWAEGRTLTRYIYFCSKCTSVRISRSKRKSNLCNSCSKTHAKKRNKHVIYFDFNTMKTVHIKPEKKKYFITCKDCKDIREVAQCTFSTYGKDARCKSCACKAKPRTYEKSDKQVKKQARKLPKPKQVSKEAIEVEIERNRFHRASVKHVAIKTNQEVKDEAMIKLWLSNNKITVLPDVVSDLDLAMGRKTGFCNA